MLAQPGQAAMNRHRSAVLLLLAAAAASGCASYMPVEAPAGTQPATLHVVAGDAQPGIAGAPVPIAPGVQVLDSSGQPLPGQAVTFSVTAGGGSVTRSEVVTDDRGHAYTGWYLGPEPGTNNALLVRAGSVGAEIQVVGGAPPFPGASWNRISRVDSAGWSAVGLDDVRARLATMPSTGFMAVAGGRVLMEYGDTEVLSYLASVRKSILSMLYGIYIDRGATRLDRTLADLGIDDHQGLTDLEKQATIHDLLAARSGIYHPASNSGDDTAHAPERGTQEPGTYYLYNNWDFNALGTIFEQETGQNIYDALGAELATPLGMENWDRSAQRKTGDLSVSMHPAYHMHLSTRDMARIGYLMLRQGRWDGAEIIPAEWVALSTSAITPRAEMNPAHRRDGPFGYGYLWWVFDDPDQDAAYDGAYVGLGAIGQHILVVPALDLVIAHKTRPGGDRVSHVQFLEVAEMVIRSRCLEWAC
jgi:CubicO group peptidase (beta-lactamase class C family)